MKAEDSLQITIASWLRWKHPNILFFHIPNGGSRNVIEAAKLKRMGVKPGMPDICIPIPNKKYISFWCELKSSTGKITSSQKEILQVLTDLNHYTCVCKSLDDFIGHFENYFKETK